MTLPATYREQDACANCKYGREFPLRLIWCEIFRLGLTRDGICPAHERRERAT